jgi:hypothetical protein
MDCYVNWIKPAGPGRPRRTPLHPDYALTHRAVMSRSRKINTPELIDEITRLLNAYLLGAKMQRRQITRRTSPREEDRVD